MKPNYLVIGAPKCATTALCKNLGKHPEVFMSNPKEPFFFSYDHIYEKSWSWYEKLFDNASGFKAIGEGSTVYSQTGTFPNTLPRIIKHIPETKIIYITRQPLDRIQSHWIEMYSQGLTMLPFNEAVIDDPQYIDASSYYKQLMAYLEHFPRERVLVLFYEDYRVNPNLVLQECFRFLNVDDTFQIEGAAKAVYASEGKRSDYKITNIIRRNLPGFVGLRNSMPKPVRNLVKNVLKKEIQGKPEWNGDIKKIIIDSIKDDTKKFLKLMNKPSDYWKLE